MPDFAAIDDRDVLLYFGLTPPRVSVGPERADEIGRATLRRIEGLPLDGLVVYDLEDESDRTDEERPFPFVRCMDPSEFVDRHLAGWQGPTIVYRSVGKDEPEGLAAWLEGQPEGRSVVLVGASSSDQRVHTSLPEAHRLRADRRPDLRLGAVAIPERHTTKGDEHERALTKQAAGVSFFITQVVYDVNAAKNFASDYAYACHGQGIAPARVVFTLSLCGSEKTLSFLQWLGVDVPKWVQNELVNSADPLSLSVVHALETARELRDFCRHLGLPCGFNVESVSNRRAEIEAAVHVARQIGFEMCS